MLNPWTHRVAIALAATWFTPALSGCIGELGDAPIEGEASGPSSGAGDGSDTGAPGSGPSTGSGSSTTAGSGGSDGSGGPVGGSGSSTTAGSGGSGGPTTAGAGGSDGGTTAGAGGSDGPTTVGAGGSDGSTTAGAGGSPAGGTGGAGGDDGPGTGGSSGAGGDDGPGSGGSSGAGGATGAAQLCVDTINQHRATLGLPPLARWTEAESCSDGESESDGNTNTAHGAFGACDERAQNECPGWPGPPESMIGSCLQLMWDEGPGEDFNKHGHYINMSSTSFTKVACGFHTFPDGSVWAVQNFR
ncbi:CAP domain-containing protein [Sorangium sp. So ce1151]|uniref:CAP domain-containing protein n=1 Tax=Sorangium sp. So ce1151 TaxID=3133332 RepID=UPI003F5FC058